MKGPEQGRQYLHSWGVYTFSGSCSSNHQALLLETLVSQAKQGSGANVVPLRELHGLDYSLTAMATLSRRTSLATHLVRSRAEEPAEIHRIPGLDRNNSDNDNNNDNNSQRLLHIYEVPGRHYYKISMQINLFNIYNSLGGSYYCYNHFTDEEMEAEDVEELAQDRKASRGTGGI